MNQSANTRPRAVTVIAWTYIVVAIFMVLGAIMGFLAFYIVQHSGSGGVPPMQNNMPATFKPILIIFQHFDILAIIQMCLAIFLIIASIQLLKLRAWARTSLEIVSWLGLIYLISFGIYWMISWVSISSTIPVTPETPNFQPMMKTFGIVMGTVVIATFTIPLIVSIKYLRGATVRGAVH